METFFLVLRYFYLYLYFYHLTIISLTFNIHECQEYSIPSAFILQMTHCALHSMMRPFTVLTSKVAQV